MSNAKHSKNTKDNAGRSVTETPGITSGRAQSERRLASGNKRAGSAAAIKGAAQAPKPKGK